MTLFLLACSAQFSSDAAVPLDTTDTQAPADTQDSSPDSTPPAPERICEPWATPADDFDQTVVPVEVDAMDPNATKIVLIAGAPSAHATGQHEFFAGMALLAQVLCQTPDVVPVIVKDGWPTDETVLTDAAAIVFYADGGEAHPLNDLARLSVIEASAAAGVGLVAMHYALEVPSAIQARVQPMFGGVYEPGYSINPIWRSVVGSVPDHAVSRGVSTLSIEDEWYYNMRWLDMTAVTPILSSVPPDSTRTTADTAANPGRAETTAWAFERADGGRSFGFTGGHFHLNWSDSDETLDADVQRRIVAQGILWAAGVEIPSEGVPVAFDAAKRTLWLDPE